MHRLQLQPRDKYVLERYALGYAMKRIATELGCDERAVKRILIANNIPIRGNSFYRRKYVYNTDFFKSIHSEIQAYWLGFIYADGFITRKDKVFSIKLSKVDKAHLELFIKHFNSNIPVNDYTNYSGFGKGNMYSQIAVVDTDIVNDLKLLGVKNNKTQNCHYPSFLFKGNEFENHFIRGFFDGDGSVYNRTQCNSLGISFSGTEEFLNGIKNTLSFTGSQANLHKESGNKQSFTLKYGGRHLVKEIYEYLYNDATIFLPRKKIILDNEYLN